MITRRTFIAGVGALGLGGCAKFPASGASSTATRLTFQFTLNGPVNISPLYYYVVAIRVLTPPVGSDPNLSDATQGPAPIIDTGSLNGIVGGLPTHYVIYTATAPNFYSVYRFPLRTPTAQDPAPIDLTWPGIYVGDVIAGSGIDPTSGQSGGTTGNQLGFTIDTSYLKQFYTDQTTVIQAIQFNILTMNVAATSSNNVGIRVMDAIGNQSAINDGTFSNPIEVPLTTSGTYTDTSVGLTETVGDTFPQNKTLPYVDLTGWSLQVSLP